MAEQAAPSFGELLEKLQEAHELELQRLRQENDALRSQAQQTPEKPTSRWRDGTTPCDQPGQAALQDAFRSEPYHRKRPPGPRPPKRPSDLGPKQPSDSGPTPVPPPEHLNGGSEEGTAEIPNERVPQATSTASGPIRRATTSRKSTRLWRLSGGRSIFEETVPKQVDFAVLAMERYPDRQWHQLTSHEKVDLLRDALKPRHSLINPRSKFMRTWDMLMGLALVFVGIVTPYEVVFLTSVHWSLFVINRVVDVIFLIDIMLNFYLAVEIQRPHRGGSIILRDPHRIRCRYLKTWFLIDVLSTFPFDILSVVLDVDVFRRAKILRCIKLMRLTKLLRILRSSKIMERWQHAINLQFATKKLMKFFVVIGVVSHWMACVWGLAGLYLGAELCDANGQVIEFGDAGVGVYQVSWITTLYVGGKHSPDSPCNHVEIYAASLHWAVMTLTSIGYGDIVPVRLEEYIVGVFCMLLGGILWAYTIGSLCSIMSNTSPVESRYETNTDLLNLAMSEARVPQMERQKYREFLREAKACDRRVAFGQMAEAFSPMLQKHLMYHVSKEAMETVYYFKDPEAPPTFLMDVASCLVPHFFSPREPLDSLRSCLCMLDRGTIAHGGLILVPPSVFHEDFIITQKKYQKVKSTISLTYTQVLVLTRDKMEEILDAHPRFARKIRKAAARTAFCRAVKLTMVTYQKWVAMMPPGTELSLGEAFDKACGGSCYALPKNLRSPSSREIQ
mmetsp:Transcript_62218/g.181676  ORF Transcript_62218/g.181676 Transcript_62218/m.181676 type:complete len:731 (+) Transcript_62218:48-2240(+)